MTGGPLGEPGLYHGVSDGFLHQGFVNMMAPLFLSLVIDPSVFLGKDPLPTLVLRRIGILTVECMWKLGRRKLGTFYIFRAYSGKTS